MERRAVYYPTNTIVVTERHVLQLRNDENSAMLKNKEEVQNGWNPWEELRKHLRRQRSWGEALWPETVVATGPSAGIPFQQVPSTPSPFL